MLSGFPVLACVRAGLTLQSFVELTHSDRAAFEYSDVRMAQNLEQPHQTIIRLPSLRYLSCDFTSTWFDEEGGEHDSETFNPAELSQFTAAHPESYISGSISYEAPRLDTLTVIGYTENTLRWVGLHALATLAISVCWKRMVSDAKVQLVRIALRVGGQL